MEERVWSKTHAVGSCEIVPPSSFRRELMKFSFSSFIHARHSRDRLRISREMLAFIFTYHQVMPSFLDFIFPFGHQQYAEDFYFSGFREDTRLSVLDGGLQIPELGRSGRELRVCYSLKSVESIPNADDNGFHWPWSVRQTALYTSFDIVTGKSFWTIIKGNHLIRDRIQSVSDANSIETTASAFVSALDTHLVLCEWCVEDWRWYLSFLEKKLQQLTRRALAVDMSGISTFVESSFQSQEKLPTTSITRGFSDISKRHFTFSRRQSGISLQIQQGPKFPLQTLPERLEKPGSNIPPQLPPVLPPGMGGPMQQDFEDLDDVVSVGALQKVQHIEDKATEVLLAITSNIKVVENIRDHYQKAFSAILEDCPLDFQEQCNARMGRFKKRIFNVLGDLNMGRDSAEILLSLINRRRELLSGLLDIRNIEASQRVAKEAQYSAKKMEAMTESMHQIAIKTKQETVSMRIITLVTLFFLPGTFISVRTSLSCYIWSSTDRSFY
ncbi:hypothetical protein B0O99DRAFT_616213 [Bisporella sp. PMI_857]|nr:hypothetical protein B0O99DRAFT_616213 [Bisporella sp. PMI_857]